MSFTDTMLNRTSKDVFEKGDYQLTPREGQFGVQI
jgi:hypothetical protein